MRVVLALVSLVSFVPQHMGSGDSVQARDTQSVIESVTPSLPGGVKVSVVGSDTFIRIESRGHNVQVPGYENEPYLRINKNGVVQVNDSSQTTVLNGNRYGSVDLSTFKKSDIPKWRTIATSGIAMWHDHRSHWMSPIRPAVIDDAGTVLKWTVPVIVDGVQTQIRGTLYLRAEAPMMWWGIALLALLLAVFVSSWNSRALRMLVVLIACLGVFVGAQEFIGLPTGARITPVLLLFSIGATLLASASLVGERWKMPSHVSASLNAGAGAALLVAVWLCVGQVRSAYVPGLDAPWIARTTLTAMVGVGVVAVVDAFIRITKNAS